MELFIPIPNSMAYLGGVNPTGVGIAKKWPRYGLSTSCSKNKTLYKSKIKSSFLDKYTNSITMKQSNFVKVSAQIGFILKKSSR